jgi:hypothetical protein
MSKDYTQEIQVESVEQFPPEAFDDALETVGDFHRKAAHYFSEAARQHLAAAAADDEGDEVALELHAFKAYRHQLNGVQCAEIAVMESEEEATDEEFVAEEETRAA